MMTMNRNDKQAILDRALAGGREICNNGHYYIEGSWQWNKGHKQCLVCRKAALRRRRIRAQKKPPGNHPRRPICKFKKK